MTDIWVCSTCHSINRQRDDRCYKCGGPQSQATGELADMRTERAVQTRAVVPYRGSFLRFVVASAFIIAVAVLGVIVLNESLGALRYLRDQIPDILGTGVIDERELARRSAGAVIPALAHTVCAIGALLFFAAWLSRVIADIPALGGGTPDATPTRAFVTPLIPIWNLFKTPPIIQEALYRLDPKAGGLFMIVVAWVGLVGSWIVSFVVGWWVNLRILSIGANAATLSEAIDGVQQAYDIQVIVDIITTLMVSAGAIVLVVIMVRIQSRARARNREILAAAAAAGGGPALTAGPIAREAEAPGRHGDAVRGDARSRRASHSSPTRPRRWSWLTDGRRDRRDGAEALGPAPGTAVSATSLGASPFGSGSGPQLDVGVGRRGITVSVAGSPPEPTSLEDLREAADALIDAHGTALVIANDAGDETAATVEEIVRLFRSAGVPTRQG